MQQLIRLSNLKHTQNNVRQVEASQSGMTSLVASIESHGLLHNLVVHKDGNSYEVVDGNRRLKALKSIYGDSSGEEISCIVIDKNQETEVGLHANMMRENMHPLDECDAIQALVSDGSEDYDSVAKRFGQTSKWVQQRVSLSELSDKAKEKFRNYEFGIGVAMSFTLGSKEMQDNYIDNHSADYKFLASSVKNAMTLKKINVKHALFDLEEPSPQTIEDLAIESDLFSDDMFVTDIDKFNEYQDAHIKSLVKSYINDGYADVVYLKDEHWFDSPACIGYSIAHVQHENMTVEERGDYILVLSYSTIRYNLTQHIMQTVESKEQEIVDSIEEHTEVDQTPVTLSKPQESLLKGYYADFAKSEWWKKPQSSIHKFMMAIFCHRRLGYTYSDINRVGDLYADYQQMFPSEEYPDDYTIPDYEVYINTHKDACKLAFDNDGTPPLHYCINLSNEELTKLFNAICLTGISKAHMLNETVREITPDFTQGKKWFKPDTKWLNKYKVPQIDMLEEYLWGEVQSGSKKQRVKDISIYLSKYPYFDPFGDWPQDKPK